MKKMSASRRTFLGMGAAVAALPAAAPAATNAATAVEAEIRRRAAHHLGQKRLLVDYYRIYRTLAYPLPVKRIITPTLVAPGIREYPWETWMLWSLEERICALGWAAEWTRDAGMMATAARDLEALASFPNYCTTEKPDLATGHAGRVLHLAGRQWSWVPPELKEKIRAACRRHVDEILPRTRLAFGTPATKAELLGGPQPLRKLHNIPWIGTVGAALAADVCGHAAAAELNRDLTLLLECLLDTRPTGYTEGVAYDGYVLDFVADWLATLPAGERDRLLNHPRLDDALEASYRLGVPGAVNQVAPIGDVEPRQMPFHFSAQVKLARWRPTPARLWLVGQWPLDWMRADALGQLQGLPAGPAAAAPVEPAANAHYAVVLRSGWQAEDLAVAMSATTSPTGHLPPDNGTILIGTRGEWLLSDPGYQQYMAGEERQFTLGPTAHNAPIINSKPQKEKRARLLRLEPGTAAVDLSGCYTDPCQVKRHVWLEGRTTVVVADQISGPGIESVSYHWHGHPRAAWWEEDGWLLVELDGTRLWLGSPQAKLALKDVHRLPGSRGQLTAVAPVAPTAAPFWWVFALGERPPEVTPLAGGLGVGARRYHL
jgi:hypothetical protein